MNEESCIFCKVVRGELPSDIVSETEGTVAFVDLHPNNFGHTLVVPKVHYPDIFSMPEDMVSKVFIEAKRVAAAVQSAVSADGVNIYMNNGAAAGQVIFHAHIHVIPRFHGDSLKTFPTKSYEHDGHKKEIGEKIPDHSLPYISLLLPHLDGEVIFFV